jgi:hypothetical protein
VVGDHVYFSSQVEQSVMTAEMNRDVTAYTDSIRFTHSSYVCPPYFQVADGTWYSAWSAGYDIYTGQMNFDGSGWTDTRRTFTPGQSHRCELQATDEMVYFIYLEEVNGIWQIFTASMNLDGSNWNAVQRTNYTAWYGGKMTEGHVRFRIAGDKYYAAWSYPDENGYWQIWTAEMNVDGTDWQAVQRTTGAPSKWRPELQVVGGKIYYTWWQGSSSWTGQAIWTGEYGSNIVNKGSSYGIGMDNDREVNGFINDDWTFTRYRALALTSPGAQAFSTIDTGWHHVAMTYNQTDVKLYINGVLTSSTELTEPIPTNGFILSIGDNFEGAVDEVKIFDRALSNSEIEDHYNEGIASITLSPDSSLKKCGAQDTLWFSVNERVEDLEGALLKVTYDDDFVTPTDVVKGPDLTPESNYFLYHDIYPDSVLISLAVLDDSFYGPGTIIGMIYTSENETASTQIIIERSSLRNSLNEEIVHYTTDATVQIDCSLPLAMVLSPPSGNTYNILPTLEILFQDDVGLNKGFYQVDDCAGLWTELWTYNSASQDTTMEWDLSGLPEGSHMIYFKVIDDAGNVNDDSCTYSWDYTYGMPNISILPAFELNRCTGVDTFWINMDDYSFNVKAIFANIGYDAGYLTPTEVIKGPDLMPSSDYTVFGNIYEDSVLVNMAALTGEFSGPGSIVGIVYTAIAETSSTHLSIDSSIIRNPENQDIPHSSEEADLQIDCTIPTAVVTSPSSGEYYESFPTLDISMQDDLGLDRGYYQINGCDGPWQEFWSYNSNSLDTSLLWQIPTLAEGTHSIYLKAEDDAGNINDDTCAYEWSFIYDVTPPGLVVIDPGTNGVWGELPMLTIQLQDNTGLNRGYYQIDGCAGPWQELWSYNSNSADTTISWQLPTVTQGTHVVYFKVVDDGGHVFQDTCSYSWTFTYDNIPPTFQVLNPDPGGHYYGEMPTLSMQFHDNINLNMAFYQIDNCVDSWQEIWSYNCSSNDTTVSWNIPQVSSGEHEIYFKIIDDANHPNIDTCSYSWNFIYGSYICGDANGDGSVNVSDAVYIINYIFIGGDAPDPLASANVNCDMGVNVSDAVWIINYIFIGGNDPCDWDGDGMPDC